MEAKDIGGGGGGGGACSGGRPVEAMDAVEAVVVLRGAVRAEESLG